MSTMVYKKFLEGLERQYVEKYVSDQDDDPSVRIYLSDYEEGILDGIDYALTNAVCENCIYYFHEQCVNPDNLALANIKLPKDFGCNRFRLKKRSK